jgi:hypothetical protein
MPRSHGMLLVLLAFGCARASPEPPARETAAARSDARASSPSAAAPAASVAAPVLAAPSETPERPFRFPAAERVVAVGDLHGDLASTREALRLAGAIDSADRWVGKNLVLVQVGDQLDRGDDEPEILRLLERVTAEAREQGGAVHVLNGNHEIMNAAGDLRYVTEDGLRDYASVPPSAKLPPNVPAEARGRAAAFSPGSELSRKLAERNTVAIVGDTLFAHAGVLPKHVRYGIGRINDEVRRFFRGELAGLPEVVGSDDAPVWTRVFGGPTTSPEACRELDAVLSALSVKRLVVGHTVQKAGITSACAERVFRIDIGLSDYYGNNRSQVLEIAPGGVKVLGG